MDSPLFSPYTLNNKLDLRNRAVMAPMTINSSTSEGLVTDEELAYYLVRSTDVGMVVTAGAYVSSEGQAFENSMSVAKDSTVPQLRKLAKVIQLQGAKAILQIYHGGRMARSSFSQGRQPVAPSHQKANRPWAELPRVLSHVEIELIIKQFGQATRRAIEAGFDGIELHGANTYLLQQFFSPDSNRRTDQWGGSFENRLTFPMRVIEEVKAVADQYADENFVIGYRISPEEVENPGIRLKDTLVFIDELISAKMDYIHLSVGHYYQPSIVGIGNYHQNIPKHIYQHINGRLPMINVGSIKTVEDAEAALAYSDLISLGRQIVVDPKWLEKVYTKDDKAIYKSIGLNDQSKLTIPDPLWQIIINSPGWFPVDKR